MDIDLAVVDLIVRIFNFAFFILAVLAVIFQGWAKEWIKTQFLRDFTNELEEKKHEFNIALEQTKNNFMREMEFFRADIDIKRSISLKMAAARLEALKDLHVCFSRFTNEVLAMATMDDDLRTANIDEYNDASESLRKAKHEAEIFLDSHTRLMIMEHVCKGIDLQGSAKDSPGGVLPDEHELLNAYRDSAIELSDRIRAEIFAKPLGLKDS